MSRGNALPAWAPADELYVIGDCEGLYISNGEYYSTVPSQQYQRTTWMAVERGHSFQHTFRMTFNRPQSGGNESLPLVTAGSSTVLVTVTPSSKHHPVTVDFGLSGPGRTLYGVPASVTPGSTHQAVVITDPVKHLVEVTMDGTLYLSRTLVNGEPIVGHPVHQQTAGDPPALSVLDQTASTPKPTLCRSLIH